MAMYRTELKKSPLMRLSYAFGLFNPQKDDKGNPTEKYTVTLILPKSDTEGLRKLQEMVADVVTGQWGEKGVERFKKGLIKSPILDGASKSALDKDGNHKPGLSDDVVFIRPITYRKPKVFNAQVMPASEDEVRSGYWGYAALNALAWHNPSNGDGISFGIDMFQVTKEDEILGGGGGANPDSFFEAVGGSSDDTRGSTGGGKGAGGMFD
jgi:hypothetical protein